MSEILIGSRVKSYDFPDTLPERKELCYVVGKVVDIASEFEGVPWEGFDRYKIAVEYHVFSGKRLPPAQTEDFVYPPENGIPIVGGGKTNGVVLFPENSPSQT